MKEAESNKLHSIILSGRLWCQAGINATLKIYYYLQQLKPYNKAGILLQEKKKTKKTTMVLLGQNFLYFLRPGLVLLIFLNFI